MKFTALFTAFVLLFLIVIPVSATEIPNEEPETRYICDADGDGAVTATDARIILRHAVGLIYTPPFGWMDYNDIIYCDADKSGAIDTADARIALRTAVSLEKAESRAFEITDYTNPSCAYEPYVKAECSVTGETVNITIGRNPHSLSEEQKCAGEGYCTECKQTIKFTPQHEFYTDTCEGIKRCTVCQYTEYFEGHHDFSKGFDCSVCNISLYRDFNSILPEYLKKNGEKTKDADGKTVYVYAEADDYFTYGLLYYPDSDDVLAYSGMAVEAEGEVLYYDSCYYLYNSYIEVDCYTEDALLVTCGAWVDIKSVKNGTDNGIRMNEYQSVPELQGQQDALEIVCGSMSLLSFAWLRDFAQRINYEHADLLFSNNPAFS